MIKNLKKLRRDKGITQKQLANMLGVSQQSVNKYENHNVEPDLSTVMKMADYFGTSVDYLIGYTDAETENASLHTVSEEEAVLLRSWRVLSSSQRAAISAIIESYQ